MRRVAVPDAFFATDGVHQTTLHVLAGFGAFPRIVADELAATSPTWPPPRCWSSWSVAASAGSRPTSSSRATPSPPRSAAREEGAAAEGLVDRLAADDDVPLDRAGLEALMADPLAFVGDARRQVAAFAATVEKLVGEHPAAASYQPGPPAVERAA